MRSSDGSGSGVSLGMIDRQSRLGTWDCGCRRTAVDRRRAKARRNGRLAVDRRGPGPRIRLWPSLYLSRCPSCYRLDSSETQTRPAVHSAALVSRSTTLPQWLLDWACSLPLSARCPTQPCHPQPPRRPLTRHRNGRGDLRGVPRPKAVRGPPRECRHSAAGWPKRCLVGGLPAWLPGWRGRQGAGGSRFRCTHSRTSPAVASSGRRSANSRTPRIERWQIASSTAL